MKESNYDTIGKNYNDSRTADPFITSRLLHFLEPQRNGHYLDIGCGTGNYTSALAKNGFTFTGIDPSEKMLAAARQNSGTINWITAAAENIPVQDKLFNGAIATLTIHHWKDIAQSFAEIFRVLHDGSRLVLFTSTPEQMKGYWLNHYFPVMLTSSIDKMPSLDNISKLSARAGFKIVGTENYAVKDDLEDSFLYAGKNKPQLYFDEKIRNGISSFSSLANQTEVAEGLARLMADIKTGAFDTIQQSYKNNLGDYIFITLKK